MTMICPNPECLDLVETGRPGEYVDGLTVCPVCGAYLEARSGDGFEDGGEAGPIPATAPHPSPEEDFEPVFVSHDPTEVAVVKTMLESEGIRFITRGEERLSGLWVPGIVPRPGAVESGVVFLVPGSRAEAARDLLAALEEEEQE
jgi:hypothetical protein